jgi:hypothetical protein
MKAKVMIKDSDGSHKCSFYLRNLVDNVIARRLRVAVNSRNGHILSPSERVCDHHRLATSLFDGWIRVFDEVVVGVLLV